MKSKRSAAEVGHTIESVLSRLALNSNKDDVMLALKALYPLMRLKSSFRYYDKVSELLEPYLPYLDENKDNFSFYNVWNIVRMLLKNKPTHVERMLPKVLLHLNNVRIFSGWQIERIYGLGDLAAVEPKWIEKEVPFIIRKLSSSEFSTERQAAATAVGKIGMKRPDWIHHAIPLLIYYARYPEAMAYYFQHRQNEKLQRMNNRVTDYGVMVTMGVGLAPIATIALSIACITALGEIGSCSPEDVKDAIPILDHLANNHSNEYTRRNAKRALLLIRNAFLAQRERAITPAPNHMRKKINEAIPLRPIPCPKCDTVNNSSDSKFCSNCDSELHILCQCENMNPVGSLYCNQCGFALA